MKLAIFDKDGTLTTPKSGEKFVQHPEDQMLLPGVAEGISAMAADGWAMAIASNQGGVAAGHKTLDEAIAEMQYAMQLTGIREAMIAHSYEPHYGEAINFLWAEDSNEIGWDIQTHKNMRFRKPDCGMIQSLRYFRYDVVTETLFVGDRPEDQQAAANANVEFQWADEWRAQYI